VSVPNAAHAFDEMDEMRASSANSGPAFASSLTLRGC